MLHSKRREGWIPEFDGLRGIAIGLVLLFHLFVRGEFFDKVPWTNVFRLGWMGVDLFFVLSGFLMTGILLRHKESGTPSYYTQFYVKRVVRLMPLYSFVLLYAMCSYVALDDDSLISPFWLFTYFQNWPMGFGQLSVPVANPTWSLAIEEQFYLVCPFLVATLSRKQLGTVALAIVILSPLSRVLAGCLVDPFAAYHWTICRMDGLALGVLAALSVSGNGDTVWRQYAGKAAPLMVSGLLLAVVSGVRWHIDSVTWMLFGYSFVALASFCVLLAAYDRTWPVLCAVLCWRPLTFVGKISYGLYLLNEIGIGIMYDKVGLLVGDPRTNAWAMAVYVVGALALTFLLACVSWHYMERPANERKQWVVEKWIVWTDALRQWWRLYGFRIRSAS